MSFKTTLQNNSYAAVSVYALLYCIALICIFGFNYQPWTDEEHFYFTILEFIQHPTLNTLKHYEEMSTPLPFILYAVWGWLFDSSLATLRIFSLVVAFTTILSAFHLFKKAELTTAASFICILILSLNPYFIGVSFFVYTDLLCELCMIWVFISLIQRNIYACCIWLLFAILCRQYMVFFIPVIAIYLFAQKNFKLDFDLIKKEAFLLIPVIGFGILFLLWGGSSPDNKLKALYIHQAFSFHADACTAYMATSIIYTFPLLLLALCDIKKIHIYLVLPLSIGWYLLFPVQGSQVAIESMIHIDTIGLLHKTTHLLPDFAEQVIWFVLFVMSCFVFVIAFEKAITEYQSHTFLVCCSWLFFLLTMSFSYLTWEKYLLPILPMLLLLGGIQLDNYRSKQLNRIRE